MNQDRLDKVILERVRPWALVLQDCVQVVSSKEAGSIPMGEIIVACCKRRGVELPPMEVEGVILKLMMRAALGKPIVPPRMNDDKIKEEE